MKHESFFGFVNQGIEAQIFVQHVGVININQCLGGLQYRVVAYTSPLAAIQVKQSTQCEFGI